MLSTFIKLHVPSVIKIFVLSIFERPLKTCFTVMLKMVHKIIKIHLNIHSFKSVHRKCSKILNTFLFLFSNKRLVNRPGFHTTLVKIANREDHDHFDQAASSEAV